MDVDEIRRVKDQCLADLREYVPKVCEELTIIDGRLWRYVSDAIRSDMDTANVYELLGIRKELRRMQSYPVNVERVKMVLRAIEGSWMYDGNRWQHLGGGLKFSTPRGHEHVRLMPYQVWCVMGIYGYDVDVCMNKRDDGNLLPSEHLDEDGMVWDTRRLTNEAHIFQTRKSGKTEFGAALDHVEANVLGPANAQVLICTNSKEQSKIAFKAVKQFAYQIDPKAISKAGGKYLRVTADEMTWREGLPRTGEVKVMSAGGKKKDGLYASMVHADEHGSASYVKDHSDMQDLVEVCVGSMGPRRERLLLHTTTAGNVNEGPYQIQLRGVERLLLDEMQTPLGESKRTTEDGWFAFLLRLDPWETGLELTDLDHENLFRKVNRSIGVTVQPNWYHDRLRDAQRKGEDTKKEVLTKDFNVWQTEKVTDWVQPDAIRALQVERRVDDCKADEGWQVCVGMDFSMGADLHAMSYLCFRVKDDGSYDFFADMDAWISQDTLKTSSVRHLYQRWSDEGWLHVSPGEVLQPELPSDRVAELVEKGVSFIGFGYDPYKAKAPINALKALVADMTGDSGQVKEYIVPVRQNYASYNPVVEDLDFLLKDDPAMIHFSMNPLWPWEFGNCVLAVSNDGMENKKPVKANSSDACKVDNVQALASALMIFLQADGAVE